MPAWKRHERLAIALIPAILVASLLGTSQLLGQDDGDAAGLLEPTTEEVLPFAVVSVLGDGFVGAPTVAPVAAGTCRASHNGPVERAAAVVEETVVVVDNLSCPGTSMADVVRDQVPTMRPDTDLVVVGGLGLEFDWPSLSAACLQETSRSIVGCRTEASLARATAANSFLLWRSLLDQIRRIAPDATIVIVAPPVPVGTTPEVLGNPCCGETVDVNEQVRTVFEVAASLRQAVVEADDQPILAVETDVIFDQHRLDDDEPWLRTSGDYLGTPVDAGVAAMANRLVAVMPVGIMPPAPELSEAQVALVLGATTDDRADVSALTAAAPEWFADFGRADVSPTVVVVPVPATAPEAEQPEAEDAEADDDDDDDEDEQPEQAEDAEADEDDDDDEDEQPEQAEDAEADEDDDDDEDEQPEDDEAEEVEAEEVEAEQPQEAEDAGDEIVEQQDEVESPQDAANEPEDLEVETLEIIEDEVVATRALQDDPEVFTEDAVEEPVEAVEEPVEVLEEPAQPAIATSLEELTATLDALAFTDGITTLEDLAIAIARADAALEGPAADRSIIVRVSSLQQPAEPDASFSELLSGIDGEIEIIATDVDDATQWSEVVLGSNVLVSAASTERLGRALPSPDPVLQISDLVLPRSVELMLGEANSVGVGIDVLAPVEVEVTWWAADELIGVGQRAEIDTNRLGDGEHLVDIRVRSDRQELLGLTRIAVTRDGDGFDDIVTCPNTFDEDARDIDGDGQTTSCDDDDDGDGLIDALDPCPLDANANLADADLDGLPDMCDGEPRDGPGADSDGDGFADLIDNCPTTAFASQFDADADGIGNACEAGTLNPICTITGTAGDDVLRGTTGSDVICALGGNDVVLGRGGHDTVFGGPGDDRLIGGNGMDRIFGGAGNDTIEGNGGADLLLGEGGNDEILGGLGADIISGGIGADRISGEGGDDIIFGGAGPDSLLGGNGADVIDGGAGHDVIAGEFGDDYLSGGTGRDTVGGGQQDDVIIGVGPNDFVRGGGGTDIIDDDPIRVT